MKRPTERLQVSTYTGVTTLASTFLAVFDKVKISDTFTVSMDMTWGQIFPFLFLFLSGFWAIIHKEKSKEDYIKEAKEAKAKEEQK